MIVLADNDVLLKLAHCDLFDEFLTSFDVKSSDLFVVRRTRFSINAPKHRKKLGDERMQRLLTFLARIADTPHEPDEDEIALLTEQSGIDAGEAVLFAICSQLQDSFIFTGDKRCLLGLTASAETNEGCAIIHRALARKIFCFEQILSRILEHVGFDAIREKLIQGRECDTGLRLWLGSTLDANEERFREGLTSYLAEIRLAAGTLLAQ